MQAMAEPAELSASDQATPRKPRSWRYVALGLALLALGAFLFWSYASDPTGTLPGFPTVWKGGPLILCSSFLIILGAFLCLLRRFSLGGLILSAAAAGLLTASVQAFVYSIREYDTECADRFIMEEKNLGALLTRNARNLNSDRVLLFVADAYSSGRWPQPPNFDEAEVSVTPDTSPYLSPYAPGTQYFKLDVRFRHSSYIHALSPETRGLALSYVRLLHVWNGGGDVKIDPAELAVDLSDYYKGKRNEKFNLTYVFEGLSRHMTRYQNASPQHSHSLRDLADTVAWLASREPDEEFRKFLKDLSVELNKHAPRKAESKP